MIQLVCTFSDDGELNQLRALASSLNLVQVGQVAKRTFYRRIKFVSINDESGNLNSVERK